MSGGVEQAERGPFGTAELLAAVAGASRVLDAGCGSGRLTVALARAGAHVTGFDTSTERLAEAGRRAVESGVELTLVEADLNRPLPFADAAFDGLTSRLALMVADDPVATVHELVRVLEPGGRLATVIWASLPENPWFDAPREAVATVLGKERASFARVFGRLGDPDETAGVHRAAGLEDVEAHRLVEQIRRTDAGEHWELLCRENGHFRRIDADLGEDGRRAVVAELEGRLAAYRDGNALHVPRTLVLVTARRPA